MVIAWLKYLGVFLLAVVMLAIVTVLITQRVADGPIMLDRLSVEGCHLPPAR